MYQAFLIKYGEIGIKGKNRSLFEDALMTQIRRALKPVEGNFTVLKESGRIYVQAEGPFDYEEALETLQRVFGITWICPVVQMQDEGFEKLKAGVIEYMGKIYPNQGPKTFKVEAKRAKKSYPVDSMEMNRRLGEALLEAFSYLQVDVHQPQILLHVEVRDRFVNLYAEKIPGPGGMPVGTAGKAMLLLSGGIDSPVAGYMVSKRGVELEATYFHAPPYTSERAKQKVVDLAALVARYSGPIRLHVINFTDIQMYIYEKCPHDELTIIMRRYMMRIAEHLAKETGCLGLITGESIGQVASQTMMSLDCTNAVCDLPVYRPLVAFDKQDIIHISEKINTFETSILPYEDCCTIFVAKHPVTKPRREAIARSEMMLSEGIDELVQKALDSEEVLYIR